MSRRRRPPPPGHPASPGGRPVGGHGAVEEWPDGDWVVRRVTGSTSAKAYRCPGCEQAVPPVTPHVVAWPVDGSTLAGGGVGERRHWHTGCWRARDRRAPR